MPLFDIPGINPYAGMPQVNPYAGTPGINPYVGANQHPQGLMGFLQSPAAMGLAQGLLSASAPSRMPVSMGQALGSGLAGMNKMRNAEIERKLKQAQLRRYNQPQGTKRVSYGPHGEKITKEVFPSGAERVVSIEAAPPKPPKDRTASPPAGYRFKDPSNPRLGVEIIPGYAKKDKGNVGIVKLNNGQTVHESDLRGGYDQYLKMQMDNASLLSPGTPKPGTLSFREWRNAIVKPEYRFKGNKPPINRDPLGIR